MRTSGRSKRCLNLKWIAYEVSRRFGNLRSVLRDECIALKSLAHGLRSRSSANFCSFLTLDLRQLEQRWPLSHLVADHLCDCLGRRRRCDGNSLLLQLSHNFGLLRSSVQCRVGALYDCRGNSPREMLINERRRRL